MYEDDPEYEEISDYIRATHWVYKLPNGDWVRIPKPFELAFFSNLIERTLEYTYKNDPSAKDRFIEGLGHIFIPPFDPAINVANELRMNYDTFRGKSIVPDYMQGLPPHLQYNQYSSQFSRSLGELVGASPAMIDHAIQGIGGSLGREFLNFSNQFAKMLQNKTVQIIFSCGGSYGRRKEDQHRLGCFGIMSADLEVSTHKLVVVISLI